MRFSPAAMTDRQVVLLTGFISVLMTLWLLYSGDIISRDSIRYLTDSQSLLDQGPGAALQSYGGPLYSLFIIAVQSLSGLSLAESAYLLTLVFEAIICMTFVKLYALLKTKDARLWVAAIFILSFPAFNDYRADIIRGYGFWMFALLALYQFIRDFQSPHWLRTVVWQVFILCATLFRPEGIVLALAGPFFYLFIPDLGFRQRIEKIIRLNSVFILAGMLLLTALLFSADLRVLLQKSLPDQTVYLQLSSVWGNFQTASANMVEYVLPFKFSAHYAPFILASGLLSMLFLKLISNLNLLYCGLWVSGIYQRWLKPTTESRIVAYFALISLLILVVFVGSRLFLSSRYTVFLLLLVGLLLVRYLDILISKLQIAKKQHWLNMLFIFMALMFFDSMISLGAKKTPIKDSSELAEQILRPGERIACNESRHLYYTHKHCDKKNYLKETYTPAIRSKLNSQNYQYLLLWVKHKNKVMLDALSNDNQLELIASIENKKGDKGLLYKINP